MEFYKPFKNLKKTILVDEDQKNISQEMLLNKIKKIQEHFYKYSIIILVADNTFEFIAGYLASLNQKKSITILLDKTFTSKYIENIIQTFRPNFIFAPKEKKINLKKTKLEFNFEQYKLIEYDSSKKKKMNFQNFLLLSTSGTTESPKFVRLSKKNIEDNTQRIIKYLKIKSSQNTITTMPAGYSYGLSIINTHLKVGAKIILNNNTLVEKKFWEKVKKYKIESFGGVPEFYEFLRRINFEKFLNKNLKYLTQAGGKLSETDLKYLGNICKKNKIKFFVMYGQTEASPRISYLDWKFFFKKLNSVGKPLTGYKIRLFKKGKEIHKANEVGEIVVYGQNICLGYAKNLKDLRKGNLNNYTLHTGDLGYKDRDNFFYLTGRSKKIVKIFGKRYDLQEIENYLKKKGYKIKCLLEDKKLKIQIQSVKFESKIKNIIFEKFKINKNYIFLKQKSRKTFKDYNG